jgi:hypothetical protein
MDNSQYLCSTIHHVECQGERSVHGAQRAMIIDLCKCTESEGSVFRTRLESHLDQQICGFQLFGQQFPLQLL